MARYRPRSIAWLVLTGLVVVLAPFIAAIVTAIVQVDRLAREGQDAVMLARTTTENARIVFEQLAEMQRAVGQYIVTEDRDRYENYSARRQILGDAIARLLELEGLDPELVQSLQRDEQALYEALSVDDGELDNGASWRQATDTLRTLTERAENLLEAGSRMIETEVEAASENAKAVQELLVIITAAAVPVTLLLVGLFTILITKPMRALASAIRRLGTRELSEPISVIGPRDVESLGEELDWLRRRIMTLEDQKANFLRHISHELKTPLTTIREGSELLNESLQSYSSEDAEIARLMRENSLHLQRLIEDLLNFAKTSELSTDLDIRDDVDLADIVRHVADAQSVAVVSKELTVDRQIAPVLVRGDAKKLRIIVDNLLTNAIKYTPAGGRIILGLRSADRHATFDVIDTGPGIDDADLVKIFEPFQQGKARYESSVKGTGLGLAITKEYVEAHDGYIEVVASDVGAHLRVNLPLAGPAKKQA